MSANLEQPVSLNDVAAALQDVHDRAKRQPAALACVRVLLAASRDRMAAATGSSDHQDVHRCLSRMATAIAALEAAGSAVDAGANLVAHYAAGIGAPLRVDVLTAPVEPAAGRAALPQKVGPAAHTRAPHRRHDLERITVGGWVRSRNTVILPGTDVPGDVQLIRAGAGQWDAVRSRYVVRGRSYGLEADGTLFPDSGPGLVKLGRGAYKALQRYIASDGDIADADRLLAFDPSVSGDDRAVARSVFQHHHRYRG